MKKHIIFLVVAVSSATIYFGCKKETPHAPTNATSATIAEANFNSILTLHEFEIELNTNLNTKGLKENPEDPSMTELETVEIALDAEIKFRGDCTPEIFNAEQNRLFQAFRKKAWESSEDKFGKQNGRVLAYAVKEITNMPTCAANTIIQVQMKVNALLGKRAAYAPPCQMSGDYEWLYSLNLPTKIGGTYTDNMIEEMENILNSPGCNSFLPSQCPAPAPNENSPVPVTVITTCDQLYMIVPNSCTFFYVESDYSGSLSDGNYYFSNSDAQALLENIKTTVANAAPFCYCQNQSSSVAYYNVRGNYYAPLYAQTYQKRFIWVTAYYRCCGQCV